MKTKSKLAFIPIALLIGQIALVNADTSTKPIQHGENLLSNSSVKATVTEINYKTREVTLLRTDGEKVTFIAGPAIRNLNEVKIGDTVFADYSKALVYDIHKGGKATKMTESMTTTSARPGTSPAGVAERKVQASVVISEINRKEPSITIKDATGETTTYKVMHPDKLKGVKVGDTVDLTYKEAIALRVVKENKKQQ